MLKTMPNFEPGGIEETMLIFSIISLLCLGGTLLFLRDSPRNLIIHGHYEEAFDILSKLKPTPSFFNEQNKNNIIREVLEGINIQTTTSVAELFRHGLLSTTIITTIINFTCSMLFDGNQIIQNLALNKINNKQSQHDISVLTQSIIVILFGIPSNILFGLVCEMKILGRKYTMAIGFFILALCTLPLLITFQNAFVFLAFGQFFINVTNIVDVYVSEMYQTKIRDFAMGWVSSFGFMGSCISQYLFISLLNGGIKLPFIVSVVICILDGVLSIVLKIETMKRPLDSANSLDIKRNRAIINEELENLVAKED
jgi:MFS family permease